MQDTGRSMLRLLHYWWPLALGWSLAVVVERATGRTPDPRGLIVLLSGIVAAYSIDRVFDPSRARNQPWVDALLGLTGPVSAIICAWNAAHLPVHTAALMPLLGVAALAYSTLKRWTVTKTALLPLVWTWASIALPFGDGSWFGWRALLEPVAAPLFCLIAAGCLLCDLKDEEDDRMAGVRSLPALKGSAATIRVAVALAFAAAGLALLEHRPGIVVGAGVLGLATTVPGVLAADATGPLLVDVILTLPGILVAARFF